MTSQLVRYKLNKHTFEVITAPTLALKFQTQKITWTDNILESDIIFKNYAKGLKAADKDLKDAFGEALSKLDMLKLIVQKGDIQVSADERKEAHEAKVAEILQHIIKNYVEPATGLPHPRVRLEQALEAAKFRVDPEASAAKQAQDLIRALEGKLAFSRSEKEAELSVDIKYVGSVSGIVHSKCNVKSERYSPDAQSGKLEWRRQSLMDLYLR
jgi:ribosome maturation protein SDO1